MKALAALGLIGGVALAIALVLSHGAGAIWHGMTRLGWLGFAVVIACHAGLIVLMGMAWWLLGRDRARWPLFAWGRLIRDSASEALPLSQLGGYVLGARALALVGVSGAFAAGSTVVDVTVELIAQLGYTLIGLALLDFLRPGSRILGPMAAAVVLMAILAAVFSTVQARGAGAVERAGARIARHLLGRDVGQSGAVQRVILRLHDRPAILLLAASVHLTSWLLSGVETWLTLSLMGLKLSLAAGLVIDSLLYAMRSAGFMVPNSFGVQEGGLVLLCGLFGVEADAALGLSLIKRGRDLAIGVPALVAWQAMEGRRAWARPGTEAVATDGSLPE